MALTLTATIDAEARELAVTGTVDADIAPGYLFRIGTGEELLELAAFDRGVITTPITDRQRVGRDVNTWLVNRGENATSHTAGDTVFGATDAYVSSDEQDPPGPFVAASGIRTVTRHITSAEILALNSSPVTLVEGVAGKFYWPLSALMIFTYGTVPYAIEGGNFAYFGPPNISYCLLQAPLDPILTAEVNSVVADQWPLAQLSDVLLSDLDGADLAFSTPASPDPTEGDGTLDVTVLYTVVDVS